MSPDHFKTQEMCTEAVQIELNFLTRVPENTRIVQRGRAQQAIYAEV